MNDKKFTSPAVAITSMVNGFRRSGIAHSNKRTEHKAGAFTEQQFQQIQDEDHLIVELLDNDSTTKADDEKAKKAEAAKAAKEKKVREKAEKEAAAKVLKEKKAKEKAEKEAAKKAAEEVASNKGD